MRIALTGATGLLGRNLLFEVLKQNLSKLEDLEILVLGRPQKGCPLSERLDYILANDGYYYLDINPSESPELIKKINRCLIPVSFDLVLDDLGLSPRDKEILKSKKIDHFFHIAALTDFRSEKSVAERLEQINVKGTERVLNLIQELEVGQVVYIGSAYSCGSKTGLVEPDYINLNEKFRNPYEKSKLKAEILVREFAKKQGLNFKVFRPTTICGRLIEKPIGSTPKFDVFYGWARFFLKEKARKINSFKNLFKEKIEFKIRIRVNLDAGLNIIPVDYAAKILYGATILMQTKEVSYHLASPTDVPHSEYIRWIFESIKITGYKFVTQEPQDKSEIEKLYYRTVGKIFTPYITGDPMHFKTNNLAAIEKNLNISCPLIDRRNFELLINFAKKKRFGLKL